MTSLADIYAWSGTTRSTLREWRAFLRDDCDWVRRRVDGELLDLCKRCNERKDD